MRCRLRYSLASLSFAGLLASAAAAQGTGTLRGQVVDSVTRQPIARVLVISDAAAPGPESAAFTDATGHFTFPNVPTGSVSVRIRRPGYFDPVSRQENAVRTVSFVPGGAEPTIALEPAATLEGQVVLPEGEPPYGIRVELFQAAVSGGHRYWRQRDTLAVESDGTFEFAGLEPGSYLLHSQASLDPAAEQRPVHARSGYLPMFAPASREIESAGPVSLGAGQTAAVKLNLLRAVFQPVSIKVAGVTDVFPNFQVSGDGFTHWPARFDRQSGSVTVELPSGNYVLHASGGRRGAVNGTLPLHLPESASANLSITVNQVPPATLVTHSMTTAAVGPGSVMRLAQLTLLPVDAPEAPPLQLQLDQDTNSDTATIPNGIPAGRYWVNPTAGSGYVAELTSRGTNLLTEPLSVAPGTAVEMEATLRDDTGSLAVTRAGDLLREENQIQVLPLFAGGRSQQQSGPSDANTGEPVSFPNVAPGSR